MDRVQLADEIDPQRTNIVLPNNHQEVLSYGTELPYVRQTLMQARRLFKDKVLGPGFDYKAGIDLSFDALKDLTVMYEMRKDLSARLDKLAEDLKDRPMTHHSLHVPTLGADLILTTEILARSNCRAERTVRTADGMQRLASLMRPTVATVLLGRHSTAYWQMVAADSVM
jgi:hypothetical protein